jgi:hypothetical protein
MKKTTKKTGATLLLAVALFIGCEEEHETLTEEQQTEETEEATTEGSNDTAEDTLGANTSDHESAEDYQWDEKDVTKITLTGTSATISGEGASADGGKITINSAGNYQISGTLNDGRIIVDTDDAEIVRIILNGANITNTTNAPLAIIDAEKTIIILVDGSTNALADATSYIFDSDDEDEPNATLFSKDDLSIFGTGTLIIDANYNDGIASKDGLVIKSGNIEINSVDDGIRGKDYLVIKSGDISISANGDGLKSDNEDDETLGYISVESGNLTIDANGDAIQAQTDLIISGGTFDLTSGGGSSYSYNEDNSSKGMKADITITIDNGNFNIQSADDAIHSNKSISIHGGIFNIASGDDGIHADSSIGIHGGEFLITKSYESIESAIITINDGNINLTASDDGINVAGGNDGSSMNRPGYGGFNTTNSNYYLYINGGYLAVNADGDGLDANGSIEMTGGTVIVHGPTSNGNGTLDFDGSFTLDGGFFAGAGSAGMVQAPGSNSTQNSVLIGFTSTLTSGTLIHLENSEGEKLITFAPAKNCQAFLFSSSDLKNGNAYNIYTGGTSTGTATNGLYTEGTYEPGTLFENFTISSAITLINFR